jgi:hypothetical protein
VEKFTMLKSKIVAHGTSPREMTFGTGIGGLERYLQGS